MKRTKNRKKKILIVEPDKHTEKSIKKALNEISYEIYSAKNGIDSLKIIEQKLPEFVIINLNISDISGYQLCRLIKGNYSTKVITLTLKNDLISHIRAQQEGADASISLPLNIEVVKNTIKELERGEMNERK